MIIVRLQFEGYSVASAKPRSRSGFLDRNSSDAKHDQLYMQNLLRTLIPSLAISPTTTTTMYAFSCPTLSPEARRLWSIRSRLSSPASVVHSYADAGALGCRAARGSGCAKNSYRRFLQCSQGVPRRVLQSADSLPQSLPNT